MKPFSTTDIASALDRNTVFRSVRDDALKLLRGEECVVLQVDANDLETLQVLSGPKESNVCRTMLSNAVTSARAVTYAQGTEDEVSEDFLLSGIRSALCAPILVRGRVEACFFLTHHEIGGLFADDERRLAEFIATIAGAALENAEGFTQLQQLTATLEKRVEDRTAQLAASNEALEQSILDLQQFAYSASHDLQTPLRGITSFAQFLKKEYWNQPDDAADDYINRIVDGAKRMQQLITDLLEFSKIESRTTPFQPTDLNEVVDDVLALLRPSIEETHAEVTHDQLPTIVGDRAQLTQLLQNLISNGIKYHGEDPPKIHVTANGNSGKWSFAVSDNGIGIAAEHHERIFEVFRRLHSQESYPGTGIGLAVCQRIVRRHGGRLWLESAVGHGSTIYFTIEETQSRNDSLLYSYRHRWRIIYSNCGSLFLLYLARFDDGHSW